MVLMNHETGYVLAICSGFDEKTEAFGFNRATSGTKQTGSSMKPISVLAPAIDKGVITAATIFEDNPTSFENGTFNPKNYGYSYKGKQTTIYMDVPNFPELSGYYFVDDCSGGDYIVDLYYSNKNNCPFKNQGVIKNAMVYVVNDEGE